MADSSDELKERAFSQWRSLEATMLRRTVRNRLMARVLGSGSVFLSVLATAMAGVPAVPRPWIVVVGSGAALAVALRNVTKSHEQWILARRVLNQLYAERFLFEQAAGLYTDLAEDHRTRLFSTRLIEIVSDGHTSWAGHVANTADSLSASEQSALRSV